MTYEDFERDIYPRIWREAYNAGSKARDQGLPRSCNLSGRPFVTPGGSVLKVYRSVWEQGWDNDQGIPAVFRQMEAALDNAPMRPCTPEDLE